MSAAERETNIHSEDIIALQVPGQRQIHIAATVRVPDGVVDHEILEVPLDASRSSNQPFLNAKELLVIAPDTQRVRTAVVLDVHGPDSWTEALVARVAGGQPVSENTRVLVLEVDLHDAQAEALRPYE